MQHSLLTVARQALAIFALACILISCSKEEEYPYEPKITFIDLKFGKRTYPQNQDSLVLTFSYTDGNENLLLPVGFAEPPQHPYDFFQRESGKAVSSDQVEKGTVDPATLLSFDDRLFPPWDTLPQTQNPCAYTPVSSVDKKNEYLLYYQPNPFSWNLWVDVLVKTENGVFKNVLELDPNTSECFNYNARLFIPPDGKTQYPSRLIFENASAKRGTVSYTMGSWGWIMAIGDRPFKIRFQVVDRSLIKSNVIETAEYLLEDF